MASLTVRKLEEALKASLRLRAAQNGRSVEDEVRMILREATEAPVAATAPLPPTAAKSTAQSHRPRGGATTTLPRVTLIVGGGIAAYKAQARSKLQECDGQT